MNTYFDQLIIDKLSALKTWIKQTAYLPSDKNLKRQLQFNRKTHT
jgi:hypothetical protein